MFRTEVRIETLKAMARRETADGSPAEMPVYVARPQGPEGVRRPGLVLIQEIFGVNPHIQDVAQRFAAAGYVVAAPDIFHRSGHWHSFDYESVQSRPMRPMLEILNEDLVTGDVAAALDFLAAQRDVDPERIGVVGYCFGGRASLVTALRLPGRLSPAGGGGRLVPDAPLL